MSIITKNVTSDLEPNEAEKYLTIVRKVNGWSYEATIHRDEDGYTWDLIGPCVNCFGEPDWDYRGGRQEPTTKEQAVQEAIRAIEEECRLSEIVM